MKDKLTRKVILKMLFKDGLYHLSRTKGNLIFYVSVKESWHIKLGQPNNKFLDKVLKNHNVKVPLTGDFNFCEACQYGKMHLLPFKFSSSHAQEPLELVHLNVWSHTPIVSSSSFKYYVHFVDDFSGFAWIYTLK